jgi:hypothetical protein
MNERFPAKWQWYSEQGATCVENRDACGIFESDTYTFGVVVDASPRGERGIQFNAGWISQVLDRMPRELPSVTSVLSAFHAGQRYLRAERFFAERASYIALLHPREALNSYAFLCGDCSLGVRSPNGNNSWLTQPHTLVAALEELGVNSDESQRNIVTRTLNARRFQAPEVRVVPPGDLGSWVLATDGYRYLEADDTGHPKDDCSALLIGNYVGVDQATARANLFVRALPAVNDCAGTPKDGCGIALLRN